MEINKIILGDCLDIMRNIPDKSIDLILTDVQYGKKASKGTNGYGTSKNRKYTQTWDDKKLKPIYFQEMERIAKNRIIFGYNYYADILGSTNCFIIWDKVGDMKLNNPFAPAELAYTDFKRVPEKYIVRQQGFIKDTKDITVHPTQKPTELFKAIVKDFSTEETLILDPFAGSGTTAIACHDLKRNFICIEKESEYHTIACKRYEEVKAQLMLF